MEEIFKEYPYDIRYLVSNTGEVIGQYNNKLSKTINQQGYYQLNIGGKNKRVNRLVAETFIGEIPMGYQVNHIDGDKLNNHQNNLEIITPSENTKHAYRIGLKSAKGSKNNLSILNEDKVSKIKSRLNNKESCKDIAVDYNVSAWCIHNIKQGKTWKDISSATTIENTSIDGSE